MLKLLFSITLAFLLLSLGGVRARAQPVPPNPEPVSTEPLVETTSSSTQSPSNPAPVDPGAKAAVAAAGELFWQAHEAYRVGNYARAIALFEESYALAPQVEILYNIALCQAKLGQCSEAQAKFAEFSGKLPESEQPHLLKKREVLERQCPPVPAPVAPAQAGAPAGAVLDDEAEAGAVGEVAVKAHEEPAPATTPAPATQDHAPATSYWTIQTTLGWSLLGSALVAGGAALYFDSERREARSEAEALEQLVDENRAPDDAADRLAALNDDHQRAERATLIAGLAAGGCFLAGATLLVLAADTEPGGHGALPRVAFERVTLGVGAGVQVGLVGHF